MKDEEERLVEVRNQGQETRKHFLVTSTSGEVCFLTTVYRSRTRRHRDRVDKEKFMNEL